MANSKATMKRVPPKTAGQKKAVQAAVEKLNEEVNAGSTRPPTLLELAHRAVHGARQENYGDQYANFQRIADRMTLTLQDKLIEPITVQDVALLQIDVKLGRLRNTGGRHRDSVIDIAGYAECLDIVNRHEEGLARGAEAPGN